MATSNKFNFDQVKANLEKTKLELPVRLAKQAENYFTASFTKQAWENKPWIKPQRVIPGTYAYKYPKNKGLSRRTKPTLVMSGALRRAVSNSIRDAKWDLIKLQVDLPYAKIHNEGLDGMKRRTYMKQTKELEINQERLIKKSIDKIWV